jgi:uncharacterized membrane protein
MPYETMNTKLQQLWNWFESKDINLSQLKQAFSQIETKPSPQSWLQFSIKLLLTLGLACLVCGVIFFFAYNWEDMTREQKFFLIQILIGGCAIGILFSQNKSFLQYSLSFTLMMLIGALFAYFGQTYQTGKDPWELFFNWFLITLPITFMAGKNPHWILSVILLNLSLLLYLDVHSGLWGMFYNEAWQILFVSSVNFAFAEIMQRVFVKQGWMDDNLVPQLTMLAGLFGFTVLSLYFLFESHKHPLQILSYLAVMAWIYYQYKHKTINLFVLSGWVLSAIVFIISIFIRVLEDDFGGASFLFITLLITGLSAAGGNWLIRLNRAANQEVQNESE